MKFYLSSYKIGNKSEKLRTMIPNKKIGYVPNALDFSSANPERKKQHIENDVRSLKQIGIECEILDLKNYFNKKEDLDLKVRNFGAVFISGGNTFVLRQAMKISGLDYIIKKLINENTNFLYSGYSAACCVLSKNLIPYSIVDDAKDTPYKEQKKVIWEGLGLIDYIFLPHWNSNHSESKLINKEVEYCKQHNLKYKTFEDGDAIIIE